MYSNISWQAITVAGSLALLASGCAMAPKAERYMPPPMGSTWTILQSNTGSYGSGNTQTSTRRDQRSLKGRELIAFEGSEATILADPATGRWHGFYKGDAPLMTWEPDIGYEYPLEVGKTWTKTYQMTLHAAKRTVPFEVTQTVEAYEDVTVPAGTFKAFRVRSVNSAGDDNINWFSHELGIFVKATLRRTEKHAAGPGTRQNELLSQTIRK
jgi:hypothetical protein